MNLDTAVIANITEQQWILHRTYGTFQVAPAREKQPGQQACGVTAVAARKGTIDLGDKRVLDFPITAREIAEDLVHEINSDGGDASFFGVFVCAGDAPTPAELDAARGKLEEFYKKQVFIADQEWERTHNYMVITDVQRRAARWLGLEKDWSYEPKAMADCPACGEKVKPGVAVCRSCGAVLDAAKAAQFGLARFGLAPAAQVGAGTTPPAGSPDRQEEGRVVAEHATTQPRRR
jgi:hypothetical protein